MPHIAMVDGKLTQTTWSGGTGGGGTGKEHAVKSTWTEKELSDLDTFERKLLKQIVKDLEIIKKHLGIL